MKRIIVTCALVAMAVAFGAGAPAQDFNRAIIGAAKKAKQSVVNIIIYKSSERDGARRFSKNGNDMRQARITIRACSLKRPESRTTREGR